jgi:MFS family permease
MSELALTLAGCAVAVLGAARATWSPCGQSMLASLTPLGERGRGSSWRITVSAFAIGTIGAGTLCGALLAAVGSLLPVSEGVRAAAFTLVLVVALLIDATPLRRRLPVTRRQVNEDWMARYRGWVYGFGFGAQLGLGFATFVSCAAVYAAIAAEILCGRPAAGAVIGAAFGATKALSLVPTRTARDPASLMALHRRLTGLEPAVHRFVVAVEVLVVLAAGAVLM